MSASGLAAALWGAFRRILVSIGGWILGEILAEGAAALASYMRIRAHHLRARAALARTPLGKRSGLARAARWRRAAEWLTDRASSIGEVVARAWELMAASEGIRRRSPLESRA